MIFKLSCPRFLRSWVASLVKVLPALFLSVLASASASEAAEGPPRIVTTIKPLYSLVEMVLRGEAEHTLLVTGASSPHGFSLKPSQVKAVSQADRVFMVSEEALETFMGKVLASANKQDVAVEMMDVEGMRVLKNREKAIWKHDDDHDDHDHDDHDHAEHDGHGHHHGVYDPHLWLSPENARVMLDAIAASLAEIRPAMAARFKKNADSAKRRIQKLERLLEKRLKAVKDKGFAVQHDAYQYFEARYGLNNLGVVALDPERQPGAKHLRELRRALREEGAVCLFREPQFTPSNVESVADDLGIRVSVLDPIGANLEPNAKAYPRLLKDLADNLAECLSH